MAWPDIDQTLSLLWGDGWDGGACLSFLSLGSNVVLGTNPPWGAADFFAMYPKFAGMPPTPVTGSISQGSPIVTGGPGYSGLTGSIGLPVGGVGIGPATVILSVDSDTQITLSRPCTATNSTATLMVYGGPFLVPAPVLNAYILLAQASLVQARWQGTWQFAIGLYVAHFLTLWLQSDGGNECNNRGRAASAGLQRGVATAKSVGNASLTLQPVTGLDEWAGWTLTSYGIQFATFARSFGSGPLFIW